MIDFIERLVLRWFKATPKKTYLKYLEQFEQPSTSILDTPEMLVEFWERVDLRHFINGPSAKDMMYINVTTRHKDLGELVNLMTIATNALVRDDEETVMEISRNEFSTLTTMSLDDYYRVKDMGLLDFRTGVAVLKEAVRWHGINIENLQTKYHARVLNKMYNDILYVTRAMIDNMKED